MKRNVGRSDIIVNTKMVGLHTDNKQNDGLCKVNKHYNNGGLFYLAQNGETV